MSGHGHRCQYCGATYAFRDELNQHEESPTPHCDKARKFFASIPEAPPYGRQPASPPKQAAEGGRGFPAWFNEGEWWKCIPGKFMLELAEERDEAREELRLLKVEASYRKTHGTVAVATVDELKAECERLTKEMPLPTETVIDKATLEKAVQHLAYAENAFGSGLIVKIVRVNDSVREALALLRALGRGEG